MLFQSLLLNQLLCYFQLFQAVQKKCFLFNLSINQVNFNKFDKIISTNINVNSPSPIFPRIE